MEYSVWSSYFMGMSVEEEVRAFLDCGFDRAELSSEDGFALLERGEPCRVGAEFKRFADGLGFKFPQGHLWLTANICAADDTVEKLKSWLDLFLSLGITSAVLHTGGNSELDADALLARRVEALRALTGHVRGTELTICLENLTNDIDRSEPLLALVRAVDSPNLGVCLDTGHLNLRGESQYEFIKNCGGYLKALHIADNEGKSDQHMMPFGRGNVKWGEVMRGLAEVGYDRLFNLEIPGESHIPFEVRRLKLRYIKQLCEYMLSMEA